MRQTVQAAVTGWQAEQMAVLHEMMLHVADKLTPGREENGRRKVLQSRCVRRIGEFLSGFRELNPVASAPLEEFIEECRETVAGLDMKRLRSAPEARKTLADDVLLLARRLEGHVATERVASPQTVEALRAARLAVEAERTLLGFSEDTPAAIVADALEEQGAEAAALVARVAALAS